MPLDPLLLFSLLILLTGSDFIFHLVPGNAYLVRIFSARFVPFFFVVMLCRCCSCKLRNICSTVFCSFFRSFFRSFFFCAAVPYFMYVHNSSSYYNGGPYSIQGRTYGTHKNLYNSLFFPTIFGPIYYGPCNSVLRAGIFYNTGTLFCTVDYCIY